MGRATGLILDLDGTLLDGEDRLSPRVIEAVGRAAEHVPVAIASGREPTDVARYAREMGLTTPQISDNGGRLLNPTDNSTIESYPLEVDDARSITSALPGRGMRFFAVDGWKMARSLNEIQTWEITVIAASTFDRDAPVEFQEEAVRKAVELASDDVNAILSQGHDGKRWYVNYTRKGIDKGTAVRSWAQRMGVSLDGVVFVGDSHNDLEAFAVAGMPVAMGSALDEVRAAAAESVGDVYEDGVAQAIERFVLPGQ
ncbi:MAG: HAD family phosphatase [Chloroflexi bacterium]|nr:HAD family phosphatase [Chloroflexota bacterium]MBT4074411.1 HAD family phosphatase [Chloroflexota bacterium]MBT4514679.1 HAD family phosphatase [Chloroflexota bacterium]